MVYSARNLICLLAGGPGFSVLIKFQSLFQIERYIDIPLSLKQDLKSDKN